MSEMKQGEQGGYTPDPEALRYVAEAPRLARRRALAAHVTHTFAELEVSPAAYDEIRGLLEAAGYQHAFLDGGAIDMHGIGLVRGEAAPPEADALLQRLEDGVIDPSEMLERLADLTGLPIPDAASRPRE